MKRIKTSLPDDAYEALLAEAEKHGVPIAEQARIYIQVALQAAGYEINMTQVKWGGDRKSNKRSD